MRGSWLLAALAAALVAAVASGEDEETRPMAPEVGKPAPAFRLNDDHGNAVAVGPGATTSWTVLAFYPKAMTPG